MKNFHRFGLVAAIAFGVAIAFLLWSSYSAQPTPHARTALRVVLVAGVAFLSWYLREEHQRAHPASLTGDVPFTRHLEALTTFDDNVAVASTWLAPGNTVRAVLAVGEQGFDARLRRAESPPDATPLDGVRVAVQLLVPASALAALAPGSTARVFIDGGPTGTARVLPTSAPAP